MSLVITISAAIAAITMSTGSRLGTDDPNSDHSNAETAMIDVDSMVKLLEHKLGASLPTAADFQSENWMEALYTVASQGMSLEAFQAWGRRLIEGDCFPANYRQVAERKRGLSSLYSFNGNPVACQMRGSQHGAPCSTLASELGFNYRRAKLAALIPNLFLPDMTYKCPKSKKFFEELDSSSFDKLVQEYHRNRDRTDQKRAEQMLSRIKQWLPSVPSSRVVCRQFIDVVAEGTQWAPFIVARRSDSDVWGIHYRKDVARWILSIRSVVDWNFDPEGTSPPPPPADDVNSKHYLEQIYSGNLQAMKKMKLDQGSDIQGNYKAPCCH